jgi:hypothetical protein
MKQPPPQEGAMPPDLQFTATLGECIGCGPRGLLNERRHCCDCLDAAMNKADALDSLDLAVQKCLEADLTEIQIRDATLKVDHRTRWPARVRRSARAPIQRL